MHTTLNLVQFCATTVLCSIFVKQISGRKPWEFTMNEICTRPLSRTVHSRAKPPWSQGINLSHIPSSLRLSVFARVYFFFATSFLASLREYSSSLRPHSLRPCARFPFHLLLCCRNRHYVLSEVVFIELKRYRGRIITAETCCTVLGSFLYGIEHPLDREVAERICTQVVLYCRDLL